MTVTHIIDSDPATRLAARRVLERAGFTVTEADDARRVPPASPGLVIADLAVVSLSLIRRRHPMARVLATASEGVAGCEAASIAGSLRKPFTPSQLLAAVRRCLARPCATTGSRRRSPRPQPRQA